MTDRELLAENGRLRFRVKELEAERDAARNDALEEAAHSVERSGPVTQDMESTQICGWLDDAAVAIRALKDQP